MKKEKFIKILKVISYIATAVAGYLSNGVL